jgi:hypothetical protein
VSLVKHDMHIPFLVLASQAGLISIAMVDILAGSLHYRTPCGRTHAFPREGTSRVY